MRKLTAVLSFLVLCASSVLTAQEMDVNYYHITKESLKIKDTNSDTADVDRSDVPVGIALNVDIPFNSGVFQVGMNFDIGMDFVSTYKMGGWGEQEDFFTGSWYLSLGALFRLNLGRHNALSFRPGLQFTQVLGTGSMYLYGNDSGIDIETDAKYLALSLNLGYTLWFTNGFGLNVGIDYDRPLAGNYKITNRDDKSDSYTYGIDGTSCFRVYVGLAFYLGDRTGGTMTAPAASTVAAREKAPAPEEHAAEKSPEPAPAAEDAAPAEPAAAETSSPEPEPSSTEPVPAAAASGPTKASTALDTNKFSRAQKSRLYNIKTGGRISGPYTLETLAQMARTGKLTSSTPVLPKDSTSWTTAGEASDLSKLFK